MTGYGVYGVDFDFIQGFGLPIAGVLLIDREPGSCECPMGYAGLCLGQV